jgi:hypothetical protein
VTVALFYFVILSTVDVLLCFSLETSVVSENRFDNCLNKIRRSYNCLRSFFISHT